MKKKKVLIAVLSIVMVISMVLGTITLMSPKARAENISVTPNGGVSSINDVTAAKNYYLNKKITPNSDGTWDVEIAMNNWNKDITSSETTYAPVDVVFIVDNSFSMSADQHNRMIGAVQAIEVSLLQMYKTIWRPQEIKASEAQGTRLPRLTAVSLGGANGVISDKWTYIGQENASTQSATAMSTVSTAVLASGANLNNIVTAGATHKLMKSHSTGIWGTYIDGALNKAKPLLSSADQNRQKVVVLFSDGEYAIAGDFTNSLIRSDAEKTVKAAYDIKTGDAYKNKQTGSPAVIYSIMITSDKNKTLNNVFQDYNVVMGIGEGKTQVAPWLMLEISSSHKNNGAGLYNTYTYSPGQTHGNVQWETTASGTPVAMGLWYKDSTSYDSFKEIIKQRTLDTLTTSDKVTSKHFTSTTNICECLNYKYFDFASPITLEVRPYTASGFGNVTKTGTLRLREYTEYFTPETIAALDALGPDDEGYLDRAYWTPAPFRSSAKTQRPGTPYYRTDKANWNGDTAYDFVAETCKLTQTASGAKTYEGGRLYIKYKVKLRDDIVRAESMDVQMFNNEFIEGSNYDQTPYGDTGMKFSAVYKNNSIISKPQHYLGNYTVHIEGASYEVIYRNADGNGAGCNDNNNGAKYPHGTQYTIKSTDETVTSQTHMTDEPFLYWNTESDGSGTTYRPGQRTELTNDLILYGIWDNLRTVTYHANGGDESSVPDEQTAGSTTPIILSSDIPTRSGYQFAFWYTEPGSGISGSETGGSKYYPGETYSGEDDVDLYAYWTASTDIQILYLPNSPTVYAWADDFSVTNMPSPQQDTKTTDVNYTLSSSIPQYINDSNYALFKFKEWNTKADGTGTAYHPEDVYTQNSSLTLFAIWTPSSVQISYSSGTYSVGNNPTGIVEGEDPPSVTLTAGINETYAIPEVPYTMTRYLVYVLNDSENETLVQPSATETEIHTLNALEETVYNSDDTIKDYLQAVTRNPLQWFDDGVYGDFWLPHDEGSYDDWNLMFADDRDDNLEAHITMSPRWSNINATIGFAAKPGYKFTGWNTSPTGDGIPYNYTPGHTRQVSLTNTYLYLYPMFEPLECEVEYNANVPENEYTGSMANTPFTFGTETTLSANAFERNGFVFAGWATEPNGEKLYDDEASVTFTADQLDEDNKVVLYAVWEGADYTLTYNYSANGGVHDDETESHASGSIVVLKEGIEAKEGWQFEGWALTPDSTDIYSSIAMPDQNTTVYAVYSKMFTANYHYADPETNNIVEYSKPAIAYNNDGYVDLVFRDPSDQSVTFIPENTSLSDIETPLTFNHWAEKSDIIFGFWNWDNQTEINNNILDMGNEFTDKYANYTDGTYLYYDDLKGADLQGWYDMSRYGTDMPDVIDLYAVYKTDLKLKYDMQGGKAAGDVSQLDPSIIHDILFHCTDDSIPVVLSYNVRPYGSDEGETMSKTGNVFDGWIMENIIENVTENDGLFKIPRPSGLDKFYTIKTDETATAKWDPAEFTIYYDTDGGTPAVNSKTVVYNTAIPSVTENVIKDTYSFTGWTYYKDAGHSIEAGVSEGDNMPAYDLYAKAGWSRTPYVLTYDYATNGGDSADETTQSHFKNENVDINSNKAYKNGWTFVGWNTDPNAHTGLTEFVMPGSAATLYAVYSKDITATFYYADSETPIDIYNGSNEPSDKVVTSTEIKTAYNNDTEVQFDGLTPSDFTSTGIADPASFVSWINGSGNTDTELKASVNASAYAYNASYQQNVVLTYDGKGGSPVPPSETFNVTYKANTNGTLTQDASSAETQVGAEPGKTGYRFDGWKFTVDSNTPWTAPGEVTRVYSPDETITVYRDTELDAQWTAIPYKIFYDTDGGLPEIPDATKTVEDTIPVVTTAVLKNNYILHGWKYYTDESHETPYLYNGNPVIEGETPMPAHNLYALADWAVNTYTIKYNANGGSGDPIPSKTVLRDTDTTLAENTFNPVGPTYHFVCWNTEPDGTGTTYSEGQVVSNIAPAGDTVTLYAQWLKFEKSVELLDGTFAPGKRVKYTITATVPTPMYSVGIIDFIPDGLEVIEDTFSEDIDDNGVVLAVDETAFNTGAGYTVTKTITLNVLSEYRNGTPVKDGDVISNTAQLKYYEEPVVTPEYSDTIPSNTVENTVGYFTIIYERRDGETGDVPVDENYYVPNDSAVIKYNPFTKDEDTFIGWEDQNGNVYPENQVITIEGNIVLHALWGRVTKESNCDYIAPGETVTYTITVTFPATGSEYADVTDTLPDALVPVSVVNDGFSINGQVVSGRVYKPGSSNNAVITVTAKIVDSISSGDIISNTATATYDTTYPVDSNTDELEMGYTVTYIDGEHTYTDGRYYQNGSSVTVEAPRFNEEYTHFLGWSEYSNIDPSSLYKANDTITVNGANIVLYSARLYLKKSIVEPRTNYIPGEEITYSIEVKVPYGCNFRLTDALPAGLEFKEANSADNEVTTSNNGNTVICQIDASANTVYHIIVNAKITESAAPESVITNKATATLGNDPYDSNDVEADIADWFKVVYDANGADGEVPVDANYYRAGDEVTILSAELLSKESAHFGYWSTETVKGGPKYHPDDTTTDFSDDIVLYAIFIDEYSLPETGAYGIVILAAIALIAVGAYFVLRRKGKVN